MRFDTVANWLDFLKEVHLPGVNLGLERVGKIAKKLSLTSFCCPVVTVAGTNGKGSLIRAMQALYQRAGYQVAVFTSPHIMQFNERIVFDDIQISDDELVLIFDQLYKAFDGQPFSFFEFTTLASLYYFKQCDPDIVLLEVGLGGRLDAVNIVEPDISVITSIDLDHTEFLGETRELIAREKAGIMRQGKPVLCLDPDPPSPIATVAELKKAKLYQINQDFSYAIDDQQFYYQGFNHMVNLPSPTLHPAAICGALAVRELFTNRCPVDSTTLKRLHSVTLLGRFETVNSKPKVIVDVAHNPAALKGVVQQVRLLYPSHKIHFIFGLLQRKCIDSTLKAIHEMVDAWYCVDISHDNLDHAAWSVDDIVSNLLNLTEQPISGFDSVADALQAAYNDIGFEEQAVILAAGSFHLVADIKKLNLEELNK